MLGDLAGDDWLLILRLSFLGLALFLFTKVHGFSLDNIAFGGRDDWVLHVEQVALDVEEDGGRWLHDAGHERVLYQLEVELLGRVVAECCISMRQVQLEEVRAAEGVGVDALWCQRVDVVVVTCMLAEETSTGGVVTLGSDLELHYHLLGLIGSTQKECLLAMCALDVILSPVLVEFEFGLVRNDETAWITTC